MALAIPNENVPPASLEVSAQIFVSFNWRI